LESGPWQQYKKKTEYKPFKVWIQNIGGLAQLKKMEKSFLQELKGFDSEDYDPYNQDYRGRSGYCILTLQIALWGLFWSFKNKNNKKIINNEEEKTSSLSSSNSSQIPKCKPKWLPDWPFEEIKGFEVLMWIVLVGADADTYGATAGGLLAAYHPEIPEIYFQNLKVQKSVEKLFDTLFTHRRN